jgi:hypothetical protein
VGQLQTGKFMSVNFDFNFWTMVIFILNFGVMIFTAISNTGRVKSEDLKKILEALRADIKAVDESARNTIQGQAIMIARLRADMDNAIDENDVIAIHNRVNEMLQQFSEMKGEMKSLVKAVEQMSQFMLNNRN